MKKINYFYIVISILLVLIPLICFSICSTIVNKELVSKYDNLTVYESEYYLKLYFWWVFLVFSPISFVFLVISFRKGHSIFTITFMVLILVLCLISFKIFYDKKQFTTSSDILLEIQNSINYEFPSETCILFKIKEESYSDYLKKYEGIIRLPSKETLEDDDFSKIKWYSSLDLSISNRLPEKFNFIISGLDKYFYSFSENGDMLVLSYNKEENIIYCISIIIEE